MRKILYVSLLFAILFALYGCSNNTSVKDKSIVDANKGIEKVQMITSFPGMPTKLTEDREKIQEIVNYINDLDLKKTEEKGGSSNSGYVITIFFEDSTYKEYYVVGEKYFAYGSYRYAITNNQAQKFKDFYYSLIDAQSK